MLNIANHACLVDRLIILHFKDSMFPKIPSIHEKCPPLDCVAFGKYVSTYCWPKERPSVAQERI